MNGAPKGTWTDRGVGGDYGPLKAGRRYRVVKPFLDFDREMHPVGETWTYLGTAFLPYDDGRSLFIAFDGEHEWHVRMQHRPEAQGEILDTLASYLAEA